MGTDLGVDPLVAVGGEPGPLVEPPGGRAGVAPHELAALRRHVVEGRGQHPAPMPVLRRPSAVAMPRSRQAPGRSGAHGRGSGVTIAVPTTSPSAVRAAKAAVAGVVVGGQPDPVDGLPGPQRAVAERVRDLGGATRSTTTSVSRSAMPDGTVGP